MGRYAIRCLVVGMLLILPNLARADAAGDESSLKKWEDDWAKYVLAKDATSIEAMLTADYILTDPGGGVQNRAQFVGSVKDGTLAFTDVKYDDMKVSVYGDAAVVTAQLTIKGSLGGHDVSGDYRFTDVFIRKNEAWKSVAGQVTPVMPPPPAPGK